MRINLTPEERADCVVGLQMRICVMETGNPVLRATDALNSKQNHLIRVLDSNQMRVIVRLEDLVQKLLNNENDGF